MASNPLERAVIEAARAWLGLACTDERLRHPDLERAIHALCAHEATQDPAVTERGWHEVAEGDLLKSVKNGNFYPVTRVLKVQRGKYQLVLSVAGHGVTITRPTEAEPTAWVKRCPTGGAVDTFVHVFSSGPNPRKRNP